MKTLAKTVALIYLTPALALGGSALAAAAQPSGRPNIVFILADDK